MSADLARARLAAEPPEVAATRAALERARLCLYAALTDGAPRRTVAALVERTARLRAELLRLEARS